LNSAKIFTRSKSLELPSRQRGGKKQDLDNVVHKLLRIPKH